MRNFMNMAVVASLMGGALLYGMQAQAAGFALLEYSAQGMGNAYSGAGAVAEDASTVWFNPAGITRLPSQLQVSGHLVSHLGRVKPPNFSWRLPASLVVYRYGRVPTRQPYGVSASCAFGLVHEVSKKVCW